MLPQNSLQCLLPFELKCRIASRTQHALGKVIHNAQSSEAQRQFADRTTIGLISVHPACYCG